MEILFNKKRSVFWYYSVRCKVKLMNRAAGAAEVNLYIIKAPSYFLISMKKAALGGPS